MDIEKTKACYKDLDSKEICQCEYCRNFASEIKNKYKDFAWYFEKMGVDIEKPFETMPLEEIDGYIEYAAAQYIVMGSKEGFNEIELEYNHIGKIISEDEY